ncbi:MAG: endo alpha-1,4 polygalactosaminidase [Nitrospira sp.]|nr:endo alpha-1,4 polygalactosaminidase [Nitrospira sp.]
MIKRIGVANLAIVMALLITIPVAVAQDPIAGAPVITSTPVSTTPPYNIWIPSQNASWQWQLAGIVNQSYEVDMYDIDMFNNDASVVASLHAKGRKAICYISAGSWESWRPDAYKFPESVLGKPLEGWPGEKWLDIRQIGILGPIMTARMDLCKQKGFDGIEPDNVDGYANSTGFPLTYWDQINYNIFLANEAHARGLSIGLKNDLDQIIFLVPYFDWALNEQCFQYGECLKLMPFINAGKAVFQVEYYLRLQQFCPWANLLNFNSMKKRLSLNAWRRPCR